MHANAVIAAENTQDSDGWMRAVRLQLEKKVQAMELWTKVLLEILTPILSDEQKEMVSSAV